MKKRLLHRWLAPALLLLMLAGTAASVASTPGVVVGDVVAYSYNRTTSYPTPSGLHVNSSANAFTVQILSINNSRPPGQMSVLETFSEYNNETATTNITAAINTPFFDPYTNTSYIGALGFFPFIYTDVRAGSAMLHFNLPVANSTTSVNSVHGVNVTVARTAATISVNFTEKAGDLPPSYNYMKYNSTSGVMTYGWTEVTFLGETDVFTYSLVSLTKASAQFTFPLLGFVFVGAFAVVGLLAFASWARGRGKRKRREFKPRWGR